MELYKFRTRYGLLLNHINNFQKKSGLFVLYNKYKLNIIELRDRLLKIIAHQLSFSHDRN